MTGNDYAEEALVAYETPICWVGAGTFSNQKCWTVRIEGGLSFDGSRFRVGVEEWPHQRIGPSRTRPHGWLGFDRGSSEVRPMIFQKTVRNPARHPAKRNRCPDGIESRWS